MTRDEYRQHMRRYARETSVMSFVVTKHPDFKAMLEAGESIIPYLLEDLLHPFWYCMACSGFGEEPVSTWEKEAVYPPRTTGRVCPKCDGRGSTNSWACMTLLTQIVGDDRPKIERHMQGRFELIKRTWSLWGEEHGYLPVGTTPSDQPARGIWATIRALLFGGK